jgi:putative membrane protein
MAPQTTTGARPLNWPAMVEAGLLGGAAAVLLTKALRGVLEYYIHPRYTPLVIVCGVVLLLVAAARARAILGPPESFRGRRLAYLALLVPVLLGTLVPARPLGGGALSSGALNADVAAARRAAVYDGDTTGWNLLQWATALSVSDEATLAGKPADVVGFVYHDPARPFEGFFVVRYVVTCCTADSNGVGLPVVWKDGPALKADSWVRVRATLGTATVGGRPQPALIATAVEPVPQPSPPYLYP